MSFFDWLFGKAEAPVEQASVTPARMASCVFAASLTAATTNLSSIPTNEHVRHFANVAQTMPDRLLLTVIAAALPLAVHATHGCSKQVQEEFERELFKCLQHYFHQYAPHVPGNAFIDGQRYLLERRDAGLRGDVLSGVWLIHQLKRAEPTIEEIQEAGIVGAALGNLALQWFDLKLAATG